MNVSGLKGKKKRWRGLARDLFLFPLPYPSFIPPLCKSGPGKWVIRERESEGLQLHPFEPPAAAFFFLLSFLFPPPLSYSPASSSCLFSFLREHAYTRPRLGEANSFNRSFDDGYVIKGKEEKMGWGADVYVSTRIRGRI